MAKRFTFRQLLETVPAKDRHALRQFNFQNGDERPPSVRELAIKLGFDVEEQNLPPSVSGFIEEDTWAEKGWKIVVNASHGNLRKRFTVLHEMAHYYLGHTNELEFQPSRHRATGDSFDKVYDQSEMKDERDANAWAEAVVFGQNALESAIGLYGNNTELLMRHFGVSEAVLKTAIRNRL